MASRASVPSERQRNHAIVVHVFWRAVPCQPGCRQCGCFKALQLGDQYRIGGIDLAIIIAGVLAHIGLVVVTQVHVARGRHRDVALSWAAGLVAAGVTFWLVPGAILSGEIAFLVGSLIGAAVSCSILAASRRRSLQKEPP